MSLVLVIEENIQQFQKLQHRGITLTVKLRAIDMLNKFVLPA